jgi:hypothetical protein
MTVTIQLPDGEEIDIEGTDDPKVAAQSAQKVWANKTGSAGGLPALTPLGTPGGTMPQRSAEEQMDRAGQIARQGGGRGLADLVGTGSDMTELMVNLPLAGGVGLSNYFSGRKDVAPQIDVPFGSDEIAGVASDVYEGLGGEIIPEEDMSGSEKLGYYGSRFGMGGLAGGVGLSTAVPRAASSAPARTIVGRLLQKYGNAYQARPVSTVVGDTVAGVGSGAALGGYDEYAPQGVQESFADPFLRAGAVLAGGVGAGTLKSGTEIAATKGASGFKSALGLDQEKNLPGGAYNPETNDFYRTGDVDRASADYQSRASNLDAARVNLDRQIGEFEQAGIPREAMPASGSMSDDVGLIGVENRSRVQNPTPFIEKDRAVAENVRGIYERQAPQGSDPNDLIAYGEQAQAAREAQAARHVATTQDQLQAEIDAGRQSARGLQAFEGRSGPAREALDRTVVEDTLRPMQERSNEAFNSIDPQRGAMVDAEPLVEQARAVRDTLGNLNSPAKVIPGGLLRRIERLGEELDAEGNVVEVPAQTSVGDIVDVMPELRRTEDTARQAQNYVLADNIRNLRTSMVGIVEEAAEQGDEAAQAFLDTRQAYREPGGLGYHFGGGRGEEGRKLRQDFNKDRFGRSTTPPSQTAGRFLKPGQPEKAEDLTRILEGAPNQQTGQAQVREVMLADLAESGAVDAQTGLANPEAMRRWQQKWGRTLDVFPGLRQEVDQMTNQAQTGVANRARAQNDVQVAQQHLRQTRADAAEFQRVVGHDPVKAMDAVFNSPDPRRAMRSLAEATRGNKQASDGLKAALTRYLLATDTNAAPQKTTSGRLPLSQAKTSKRLDTDAEVLAEVYSPEEMNALRSANKVLQVEARKQLRGTTGADTAEKMNLRVLELGLKAWYGILKGGGVFRTVRLALSSLPDKGAAARQLIEQAQVDPELALHLLNRKITPEGPAWNAKLQRLLAKAEFARAYNEEDEDAVPDPAR